MKLARVMVRNFRALREFSLDLAPSGEPPRLVGLIGDNGSGKSSFLWAIHLAAAVLGQTVSLSPPRLSKNDREAFYWTEFMFNESEMEILNLECERRKLGPRPLPVPVESRLGCPFAEVKNGGVVDEHLQRVLTSRAGGFDQRELREALPQVAIGTTRWRTSHLPDNRDVPQTRVTEIKRVGTVPPQTSFWGHGYGDIKQRLVNLEFIRLKREEKSSEDPLLPFKSLVDDLFEGKKKFQGVDEDLRVMFRNLDGARVEFNDLSLGERSVLALLGSILFSGLRDSIHLIDEPEQHLHPRWQRRLPDILDDQARRLGGQFILATHSAEIAEAIQEAGGVLYDLSPKAAEVRPA